MNTSNLKKYWREILIAILIGLLLWISGADTPPVHTTSPEIICITDTIVRHVPVPVRLGSRKIFLPHYDTVYQNLSGFAPSGVGGKDTLIVERIDTSWLYADVPVQEYRDTSYYIRTIGWLDSVSVMHKSCDPVPQRQKVSSYGVTIFGNVITGSGSVAPGIDISVRRLQLGYHYDVIQKGGRLTVGYRIR